MTRVLIDGDPDPDALFISIMMLIFLVMYLAHIYLLFVIYINSGIFTQEIRKLTVS